MFERSTAAKGAGSVYFDASRPGGKWIAQVTVPNAEGKRVYKRRVRNSEREALDALMELRGGEAFVYPRAPFTRDDESMCWLWNGRLDGSGYGVATVNGARIEAHRLYYQMHVAPLFADDTIDHLCCEHRCVNPDHLQAVSRGENARRAGLH